jgi:hypothetical protein
MMTKDQIFSRPPTIETVDATELAVGSTLGVKLLSAAEFLKLSAAAKANGDQAYALWIIACVCDESGTPLFSSDDIESVTALPFPLVNRLIDAAQRVNGTAKVAAGN